MRKRIRDSQARADSVDLAAVPANNPGPMQQLHSRELANKLREALAQLPEQEAEVFCLRHLNDMSYRQISKELSIKTSTTGVLLHRAKAKLRSFFETVALKEEN